MDQLNICRFCKVRPNLTALSWSCWVQCSTPSCSGGEGTRSYDADEMQEAIDEWNRLFGAQPSAETVTLSDEQIDRLVVSSCHSDPRNEHGNYVLTVGEIREILGAAATAEAKGGPLMLTDDEILAALLSVDPLAKRVPLGLAAFARAIEEAVRRTAPDREAWQPIKTAPKTGRILLLGYENSCGKWRTTRGQWMSEAYIAEYWEDPDDAEPGWYETPVEAEDPPNCWHIEPTHWMPLPAAPTDAEGEDE